MTQGEPWSGREVELLTLLRPHCHTQEIVLIFSRLGYERTYEAISRKGRKLGFKYPIQLGDPSGDFTEEESKAIDEVLTSEANPHRNNLILGQIEATYTSTNDGIIVDIVEVEENNIDPPQTFLPNNVKWVTGSIPLKEDGVTRYVQMNDVHVPHNISVLGIQEFISDFKPDYLLYVGDIVNNDPFDHWAKEKPGKAKKLPAPRPYFEKCNELFYRPMHEASGPECKKIHWVGNHEYWSNKAIEYIPEGEGYWEVWNNLDHVDYWVPFKQIANLGKLYFVHGDIIKGGKHHSTQMLQYFNRNIRYGHYHDIQEFSQSSPIDIDDRHTARSCGCLEKYNPGFMENRPHNWQNAFTFGYVRPDGTFHDTTVIIVNDKFIANGKEYKG